MKATRLRTEYMVNPMGIDIRTPLLQWNCQGGIRQTAYDLRLLEGDTILYTGGRTEGEEMQVFCPISLKSRQAVTWQVRLWDENGTPGDWSEPAFFEMGLLNPEDFTAVWINPELSCDPQEHKPASYLRRTFTVNTPAPARLYITAHGLYEAWINGKRVGDAVLTPGAGSYHTRLFYQTYDVSEYLQPGENELQILLGDGWYRSCSGVDGDRNLYGEDVALWCQLEISGKPVCISDGSWEASQEGPLRENDMQQGETVDARIVEIAGWHTVRVESFDTGNLCASNCVPVREQERFTGRLLTTPNGERVIDFGQNLAGYISFQVTAHAGDRIVLTHGEALDENGNFTQENFQDRRRHKEGGTRQQVIYTCREGKNTYKTRFSIWGFRYAKVETAADLSDAVFTAIAVYSEMERLGIFHSGNADVDRLVENTLWSMKSNFCDVPTDCPTRERAAWTGDMGVFAETGLYLADCYPVIRKWLGECRICQYKDGKVANIAPVNNRPTFTTELLAGSVGWGDACILVPDALFRRYGDLRILAENADMMTKWYGYLQSRAGAKPEAGNMDLSKIPEQYRSMLANMPKEALAEMMKKFMPASGGESNPYAEYAIETGTDYGEWCEPDVPSISSMGKPQSKVATAYYARSGRMLGEIMEELGNPEAAAEYRKIGEGAKAAFHFLAARDGRIRSDRQAEYVRALSFGLLSGEEEKQAAADLNELVIRCGYHLNTGFLSTPDLCAVLAEHGYTGTAYRLLLQETMPGWLYEVRKGATTVWEEWDGINEKGEVKASLNHYSKGAVCGWLFSGICGIRVTGRSIRIAPQPHALLGHAEARYLSPAGEIVSGWEMQENGHIRYHFSIPANTEAEITLPGGRPVHCTAGVYEMDA